MAGALRALSPGRAEATEPGALGRTIIQRWEALGQDRDIIPSSKDDPADPDRYKGGITNTICYRKPWAKDPA